MVGLTGENRSRLESGSQREAEIGDVWLGSWSVERGRHRRCARGGGWGELGQGRSMSRVALRISLSTRYDAVLD